MSMPTLSTAGHPLMDSRVTVSRLRDRVRPRPIEGISAVLLPYREDGTIDWDALVAVLTQTVEAGLQPAVNMDTGYVNLLTADERAEVLPRASATMAGRPFVAGTFLEDGGLTSSGGREAAGGVARRVVAYRRGADPIRSAGGPPILFQCAGLTSLPNDGIVAVY